MARRAAISPKEASRVGWRKVWRSLDIRQTVVRFSSARPWAAGWRSCSSGAFTNSAKPRASRGWRSSRRAILDEGVWRRPSAYSDEPYVYTRTLIEDGRRHLLLGGDLRTYAPVRILQGMRDEAVPYAHAMALLEHLHSDAATITLIRDGDHRLSRPEDLKLLVDAIEGLAGD